MGASPGEGPVAQRALEFGHLLSLIALQPTDRVERLTSPLPRKGRRSSLGHAVSNVARLAPRLGAGLHAAAHLPAGHRPSAGLALWPGAAHPHARPLLSGTPTPRLERRLPAF